MKTDMLGKSIAIVGGSFYELYIGLFQILRRGNLIMTKTNIIGKHVSINSLYNIRNMIIDIFRRSDFNGGSI